MEGYTVCLGTYTLKQGKLGPSRPSLWFCLLPCSLDPGFGRFLPLGAVSQQRQVQREKGQQTLRPKSQGRGMDE
jgi:hypothetical protein